MAKQIADLDRATWGRADAWASASAASTRRSSERSRSPEERGGRTNEIIPLPRRFWTATDVTHQGRYYEMRDVRIHPAPHSPAARRSWSPGVRSRRWEVCRRDLNRIIAASSCFGKIQVRQKKRTCFTNSRRGNFCVCDSSLAQRIFLQRDCHRLPQSKGQRLRTLLSRSRPTS